MPTENLELKSGQVVAVVGINAKQLQNAVEAGYVRPSVASRGRGSVRLYTFEDVVRLRVFDILVRAYGLEQGRAARMLSSAWPRHLTANKQTLVIAPAKASADRGLPLEPITIPLADIMTETERRISRVRKTYNEKRRGRPAGWSKRMSEALSDVSDHLQDVSDEQIRRSIAAHRAGKRGGAGGNKRD
jgi:DNA-binding transcriptional MerR regulator